MSIPYRVRRVFRHFFAGILVLILFSLLILFCWFLWLDRYVVYGPDGAKLDFDISVHYGQGQIPTAPTAASVPEVHSGSNTDDSGEVINEFATFNGYYVTLNELTKDFDGVKEKLEALPKGSTVMLELKDTRSIAYYTSTVCAQPTSFDVTQVDELLQTLFSKGHYVIARIPAFQEYYFIMENERERVPYGLAKTGGSGALWLDTSGSAACYWLNPASDGTMTYLLQQVAELRNLGFDEVVFSGFRFPATDSIKYDGDQSAALISAAATLVNTCSTDSFCVSFIRSAADLPLPEGRTRLYLTGIGASSVESIAASCDFEDPTVQLVFLTDSGDPRYDTYCVLRPLDSLE